MGSKGTFFGVVNTAGPWLALAAMVLRLAMPVGWMPAPSPASGTLIVMCTMNGPVKMVMPADGGAQKPDPAKNTHHNVCPFGAAPHFATAVPLAVQSAPVTWAHGEVELPRWPVRVARRNSAQSPRGPPLAV